MSVSRRTVLASATGAVGVHALSQQAAAAGTGAPAPATDRVLRDAADYAVAKLRPSRPG